MSHPPQFSGSEDASTQSKPQPISGSMQRDSQAPSLQMPFSGGHYGHSEPRDCDPAASVDWHILTALLQAPQLSGLDCRSTHRLSQQVRSGGHYGSCCQPRPLFFCARYNKPCDCDLQIQCRDNPRGPRHTFRQKLTKVTGRAEERPYRFVGAALDSP